jgi:tetratricopeptide (TPR) repeat protein
MPGKFYMENDYRHDHSFRVPRPDLSAKYGTPNACNDCHKDKSAKWSADAVARWHGPRRAYHFSDDLIPGSKGGDSALRHLTRLAQDTAVPGIVRATAVYYLNQTVGPQALAQLLLSFRDEDPQVRYRALQNIDVYPPAQWMDAVGPMLSDPVRAVRIAAADAFLLVPAEQVPVAFRDDFAKSKTELEAYLKSQLDFASGNMGMADFYLKQQDYGNAERYYLRGIRQDSLMNYARLNLSSMYNAQRRNDEALAILKDAEKTDSRNGRVNYQLALLLAEMNRIPEAEAQFRKALANNHTDPRLYYNYGVLVQQQGKAKEAERIFREGIRLQPMHEDLNYALAFLLMQLKREADAREPARVLKSVNPGNPGYQALFRAVGI